MGIQPIEVENLHCKLYLNESAAIVTSMNLHKFSDTNSIDIGYETTEEFEYIELLEYLDDFIVKRKVKEGVGRASVDSSKADFTAMLGEYLNSNYSSLYGEMTMFKNNYYSGLVLNNFISNYRLIFEPRGGYYRIDLRIDFPYNDKVEKFNFLRNKEGYLSNKVGHRIEFGSEMKRLKIDIGIDNDKDYSEWGKGELDKYQSLIQKVIETYKNELSKI